jgi:hypothetical protein
MGSKDKGGRETRKPKKDKKAKPVASIVHRPAGGSPESTTPKAGSSS